MKPALFSILFFWTVSLCAQPELAGRKTVSLNGTWQYIIDPYETGFYNYRFQERAESDREAYWNSDVPENRTDRKEHGYNDRFTLQVPGDWNHQDPKLLLYEGTVWYKKSFDFTRSLSGGTVFLYFGAVNYRADVYLNGKKLGMHKGGFTPFHFAIPDSVLKAKGNFLVVKVDNKRAKDEVPTVNTDWWNYGGITRDVELVEMPATYIADQFIRVSASVRGIPDSSRLPVQCSVRFGGKLPDRVEVELPELGFRRSFPVQDRNTELSFDLSGVRLWSPEHPKLYTLVLRPGTDAIRDRVGFRTIEADGHVLKLNGRPLFLRGISLHEEIPQQIRRAWSVGDARQLLGWAKELGCNMVRLAHYPHNRNMMRTADSLGLLVWSEIPVYWTIDFTSADVLEKAGRQLEEMILRDRNRASIIIWSVGNETPVSEARTEFMRKLLSQARVLDGSRLVSAALEVHHEGGKNRIDDPLGAYTDLVAVNEYLGWYGGLPSDCRTAQWELSYDKPLFFSETGAEALSGFHGDSLTRWSEEYQAWYYREQVAMMRRMPPQFSGLSPWVLADFRSPRRNNPQFQQHWNNKGLIDQKGRKKKAFYILRDYYRQMAGQ